MTRLFGLLAALAACSASAEAGSVKGQGRIALLGGWRLTPNDHFRGAAAASGFALVRSSPGGPQATGAFAYAATSSIEVAIDLFAGYEELALEQAGELSSITYGGLLGVRFLWPDALAEGLVPHLGLHAGPALVLTSNPALGATEVFTTGYAVSAGIGWRLGERLGVAAEYKLLLARGQVAGVGSINGGGQWLSLGIVFFFPPDEPGSEPFR